MFYIREISGMLGPYQPGILRNQRKAEAVSGVPSIGASPESAISEAVHQPAGPAGPAFAAYEKAIRPDTPRRRVMFAEELMSRDVVTISETALLAEASRLFARRRFRHVPAVSGEKQLVGILSDRDLLKRSMQAGWELQSVQSIMTRPVLVASKDTEMREVARVMFEERIGCVPIVEPDGRLVGIITRSDVLRTLLVQAPLELWR